MLEKNIINAYKKTGSISSVAKELGHGDQTVRFVLRENDLIDSKTSQERLDEKYKEAKSRYINGESIKNICKDLNIGTRFLSNRLQLDNIKIRGKSSTSVNIDEDTMIKIIDLYNKGNSIRTISDKLKINRHTISRELKQRGIDIKRKKYTSQEDIFEVIDTEEKAYWLGFLYADGYISKLNDNVQLIIQNRDYDHLCKFKEFCKSDHPIKYTEHVRDTGYIVKANSISIYSKKMHSDLINKGCYVCKTPMIKFPTEKQVPHEMMRHFIRGYMDGDGTIGIDKTNIFVGFVGTTEFLDGLQKIFKTNNKLFKTGKNNIAFTYKVKGNIKALNILNYLYDDATIYLERKHEIYTKHKNYLLSRLKPKLQKV